MKSSEDQPGVLIEVWRGAYWNFQFKKIKFKDYWQNFNSNQSQKTLKFPQKRKYF
jgi:hypothetical protein